MRAMRNAVVATALVLAIQATPAAAAPLTFVSATGDDTKPCTVQAQPCKTLQKGISVTPAGGEIRILSQLPSQNATIGSSLTVNGGGHTMLGKIIINSASAVVTLRDLSLNGRGLTDRGIDIVNAVAVHIEGCTVERYTSKGIFLAGGVSTELFVSDSVSRDNGDTGLYISGPTTAKLTVDDSRFENNNGDSGVRVGDGQASISRSVFSGNDVGVLQIGGTTNIAHSTAVANFIGFAVDGGEMTLESCVSRGNSNTGLFAFASTVARISNSVFTNNTNGVSNNFGANDGSILTSENNVIAGNTADLQGGTTLTTLPPQ
jgi:hypothetical protein